MVHYLLDTDVVSEVLRIRPDARVAERLRACRGEAALPSIVWHELAEAARRLPAGARRRRLGAFLREVVAPSFPVVPYDREAATWQASHRAAAPDGGAGFVDGMVAAVAAVHDLVLVTGDPTRYGRFADVRLERWHGGVPGSG